MIHEEIKKYEPGELIFIDDLYAVDSNVGKVRMQLKRLADSGNLVRFSRGVYYRPCEGGAEFDIKAAINFLVEKRFLKDGEDICGYIIDTNKRDEISVKPHNENVIEVASNKATMDYKEFKIGDASIILRRPRISVDRKNYKVLALLDLVKDIEVLPYEGCSFQLGRSGQGIELLKYLRDSKVDLCLLMDYIEKYPGKVIQNLWLMGVSFEDIRKLAVDYRTKV